MSNLIDRGDVLGVISCFFEDSFIEDADVHCAELEREINRLPAAPRWVRCEDAMPDLLQFVLVCNDEGKCVVAQYVGYQMDSMTTWRIAYTMYDTDIYDEKECGPVTHWMPIEPPKEDV